MTTEVRVVDEKTGGAKGAKAEDYSQVPPTPLTKTLMMLTEGGGSQDYEKVDAFMAFGFFLVQGTTEHLILAAARAIDEMGGIDKLDSVARVYAFGGRKYAPGNWCLGYSHRLTIASAWRHLIKYYSGETFNYEEWNGESCNEHHLAHFIFHCFALYEFHRLSRGTDDHIFFDDRYGKPAEEAA